MLFDAHWTYVRLPWCTADITSKTTLYVCDRPYVQNLCDMMYISRFKFEIFFW